MSKVHVGAYNIINPNANYNSTSGNVTNPMIENLDAGGFNIINLANPSDPNDAVNMSYVTSVIPDTSNFLELPISAPLAMGSQPITFGTTTLSGHDGFLYVGGVTVPTINNTATWTQSQVFGEGLESEGPVNMNNNYFENVNNISFFNGHTLGVDGSQNLTYNDSIVIDAQNIGGYIAAANWEPLAASDLNMNVHDVNFTSGEIFLNNQLSLSADVDGKLKYGGGEILTKKNNIIETISFTNFTPNQSDNINLVGGLPVCGTATPFLFNDPNYATPIFDIIVQFAILDNNIDLSTAYLLVGLSIGENPVNTPNDQEYLKIMGSSFVLDPVTNTYNVRIRTNDFNQYTTIVTPWATCLQNITTAGHTQAYIYCSLFGEAQNPQSGSESCYMTDLIASFNIISLLEGDDDFYISVNKNNSINGLVPINDDTNLFQCIQGGFNIAQLTNGINLVYKIQLPPAPTTGQQSIYITVKLVSHKFVVKLGCLFQNGAIIASSNTSTILYENNSVYEDADLQYNSSDHTISVLTQLTLQDSYNNCTVKCKLIMVE